MFWHVYRHRDTVMYTDTQMQTCIQTHRHRPVYTQAETYLCTNTDMYIDTVTKTCIQIQRPVYSHTDLYTYTQNCTQKHRHKLFFIYKKNTYCCNIMKGKHKNIANTGRTQGKLCLLLCWTLNLSLALAGAATSIIFDKTFFVTTKVCLP